MRFHKTLVSILLTIMLYAAPSSGAEIVDDIAAREAAADRYFLLVPFSEFADDMTEEVAKQLPPERRAKYIHIMKNEVRWDELQIAMKASIVKNFSLSEIQALTDFMSRPEGKAVMAKMKFYMADIMPAIQAEMKRVFPAQEPSSTD